MKIDKSLFVISRMDCPSEEGMIRMKLGEIAGIQNLEFDIPSRKLTVIHVGNLETIELQLNSLQLGSKLQHTEEIDAIDFNADNDQQRKLLWAVLLINFAFFVLEAITGFVSKSMGLLADGLDMLADSFVYAISLMAVGATVITKKRVARIAGYFQMVLAVVGFAEVLRRFFFVQEVPDYRLMTIISLLALMGNAASLILLQRSKNKEEAHMKASMIFTSNDVIINIGVIAAGGLVFWLNSKYPDLIVGSIVFVLVVQGAVRILKLGK